MTRHTLHSAFLQLQARVRQCAKGSAPRYRAQSSALKEDHPQDQGYNCGEREPYQAFYNPGRHTPAAGLADFVLSTPLEFVELVGFCHAVSP
jgi:hypothetical protein